MIGIPFKLSPPNEDEQNSFLDSTCVSVLLIYECVPSGVMGLDTHLLRYRKQSVKRCTNAL